MIFLKNIFETESIFIFSDVKTGTPCPLQTGILTFFLQVPIFIHGNTDKVQEQE